MNRLLNLLHGFLESSESSSLPTAKVAVQRQYLVDPLNARVRTLVQRAPTPYWKERGWQQQGPDFVGSFQTRFGSWPGFVKVSPSGRIEVFIRHPPDALQRHPHWPCFRVRNDGWFFIHPTHDVPDVSAGILSAEKTLTEAFQL